MTTAANNVVPDSSLPETAGNQRLLPRVALAMQVVVIALVILSVLFGYGRWRTGSFDLVWPWLKGQQMVFTPIQLDVGRVSANQVLEKEIKVTNVSANPLSLLGSQKSCGCLTLDEFPIEIPAMTSHSLLLKITIGTKSGKFAYTIKFFLDGQAYSFNVVTVKGSVI